jgi:hypothetical protein
LVFNYDLTMSFYIKKRNFPPFSYDLGVFLGGTVFRNSISLGSPNRPQSSIAGGGTPSVLHGYRTK